MIDAFLLVLFTTLGSSVPQAAAWHFGYLHCPFPLRSNAKGFNQVLLSTSFKKIKPLAHLVTEILDLLNV